MKEIEFEISSRREKFAGIKYDFNLARDNYFFLSYFIYPSMLFVVTSYTSYWIHQEAAPARVSLAILTILIAINFQSSIHKYVPQIPYATWMSQYMLGI
jgi:hypothetical protein